jgi:ectoine hydroxylase-related dioxygenase (phytanoyl-CoA dioxygenase family)
METLKNKGFLHFKKRIDEKTIDEIMKKINLERTNLPNYGFNENKHINLGNRIGRLHLKLNDYYRCLDYVKDEIYHILNKPVIMGSLTFENGSSQSAHIDSWFFYTKPEKDMIGIWIALEDVEDDAGPLFYYEDSHLLETKNPSDFNFTGSDNTGNKLVCNLQKKIKNLNKINVNVKKGDIFIWDYNLVHGGSKILNLEKTRNSIVFHLIDEDAELYSFNDYMKYGKNIDSKFKVNVSIKEKNGWKYQDFGCIEYINNNCKYSKIILN